MNIKNYTISIWFVVSSFVSLFAQQSPKPYLLHWTEEDGLCDNYVHTVFKDQKGWLWVGTTNGLCRFDGREFETFRYDPKSLNSVGANDVLRIIESRDNNIWIGTDGGGLSIYDYKTNQFNTLKQDLNNPQSSLSENRIYNLLQVEEEVIIGYRAIGSGKGGLTIVSEDLETIEHQLQEVNDFAGFSMKVTRSLQDENNSNVFWLGGRSFFKWNRQTKSIQEFPHPSFLPNYNSVTGVIEHSDSTLIVGMQYDGLWLFNKRTNQWMNQIHNIPINSFLKDETGRIWLADSKGFGWLDSGSYTINYEILSEGLNSGYDKNIKINKIHLIDDNFWLSTNNGLYCWIYKFQQFNTQELIIDSEEIASYPEFIGQISENKWVFLDRNRGLVITDNNMKNSELIPMHNKLGLRKAFLYKDKSKAVVILGGEKGLYKWESGMQDIQGLDIKNSLVELDEVIAWSIYVDELKNVWVGTQSSGLLQLDLSKNKVKQYLNELGNPLSLCHNKYLFEIINDQNNNLWICTDKGVSIINPKTGKFLIQNGIETIQNYIIHCAMADEYGNMWIGSRNQGLFKYNMSSEKLMNFTSVDGLLYNGVNELAIGDSILWMATRQGLCNINVHTNEIVGFDQKKGIYENSLYNSRMKKLPDDRIMLTYQNGSLFSIFKNSTLKAHFEAPDLNINNVSILSSKNNKSIIVSDKSKIELNPSENYFAIDFKGIHFLQPRGITYEYMLEEYDEEWIKSGNVNRAVYTNLPGGDYSFKVKAANHDGIWSDTKQLNIFLATPWYNTNWFYLLVVISLIGLVILIYKFRTNQIKKEADFKRQLAETEMKALRSQINPHFIFNCLNSIKSYIIDNRIEDGTEYVGRFSQLIRMILNHSKERLIPISKEIDAIKLYIWLEQERLKHKFEVKYELSFSSKPEDFKIPPLLFQPYIENAIWHGMMASETKGSLIIKIEEFEDYLFIQIIDDGIGRKASQEYKSKSVFDKPSMGLKISEGRLAQINELYDLNSKVVIEDQFIDKKYTGTIVKITFPKIKHLVKKI